MDKLISSPLHWVSQEDVENNIGFVYIIYELNTNMKYIGCKKFWSKVKYKPLKGKKNCRWKYKESNWKSYTSSSNILNEKIKDNPKNYNLEVLKLCKTVTDMKCVEAWCQLQYYIHGYWYELYNEMINLRLRIRE